MANIFLDNAPFSLHMTPMQLDRARVISRMYGGYNVRPGWWYPRDPATQLSGLGGLGRLRALRTLRTLRTLGYSYYDLLAQAGMESCSPMDSACVDRNQQRQAAVEDYWINTGMTSQSNTPGTPAPRIQVNTDAAQAAAYAAAAASAGATGNAPLPTGGSVTYGGTTYTDTQLEQAQGWANPFTQTSAAAAAAASAVGYSPRVSMTTSTGNTSQLKPGDTWVIRITGGQPGAAVKVTGGQNGARDTTPMGQTDGSGNWQASGTIDTSMIGNWSEAWTVGGTNAGSITFTVVAATQAQQSAATGKPNASAPPGNELIDLTAGGSGGAAGALNQVLGTSGNTGLLLIAGLAAAYFMFGKGR